ncbi:MAG: hypothetical protein E6G89_17055 [Alphaproteobacteria bacterium]|nr:MAG: hypothetical protein E6G89_17055 [Alphaproteobacteria bacterium]TMJ40459.1 MAG: hypothetical protein E6G87_01930 [Alphaproteobacteria bacterium]
MLTRADLDEAVRNGIITQQQSAALQGLPAARQLVRHRHAQGDERFIFMKNFNEFFIALGVVLLGVGLWAAAGAFPHFAVAFPVIFIAVMWALAEFLTRRLKLTLPSIVLAIFIVTTLAFLLKDSLSDSSSLLIASFSAAVSALLFYLRFRLPFALLLLAGGCVAAFFAIFTSLIGEPTQLFTYAMFLIAGIATLAAAQWYDMSDRERITRRADCGFWLTLIAAPLIVHPVAGLISSGQDTSVQANVLTIAVVIVFALVALIIDRRAFLVSSLAYLGGALVYAFTQLGGEQNALWITLLLMGSSVILLGVGWQRARRTVMQFVPSSLSRHLPVVRA